MNAAPKVTRVTKAPKNAMDNNVLTETIRQLLLDSCRLMSTVDPNEIDITVTVGEQTTLFYIQCPPQAVGQLLGAKGKNISSLRTIVAAMTCRQGFRSVIELPYYPK